MKQITIWIFSLSLLAMYGCQKGDPYYYDYERSAQLYDGTIYEYLMEQKGTYDSLAVVLERLPDLKQKLNQSGSEITLFAVNNRSFELALENLNTERRQNGLLPLYLEDVDLAVLDTLTNRYVFDELYPISGFEFYLDGLSIYSTKYGYEMHAFYKVLTSSGLAGGGQQQLMFSDVNESIYQRYWNSTTTATVDFRTKNGIIHTLTARHDFGFGKLTSYLSKK